MKVESMVLEFFQVNVYFLYDEQSRDGVVIDPGSEPERIIQYVKENNINIKAVLLTHGHLDHIGGAVFISKQLSVPIAAHKDSALLTNNAETNGSAHYLKQPIQFKVDILLNDGDLFNFGDFSVKTIHTPGHSPEGVCYYSSDGGVLFSGDTLFYNSIGRTDLYMSDYNQIISSIKDKLFLLPDDTKVFPGHSRPTTIGQEKKSNPYLGKP